MQVLESVFDSLNSGVRDRKSGFHTLVFSNIEDGEVATRTVILRNFDSKKLILYFNTDVRSPKVEALRLFPNSACLFYDVEQKTQLRIKTRSVIHYSDTVASTAWEKSALTSRKCYLTRFRPSQEIEECDDGISSQLKGRIPSISEASRGRENFAVVANYIQSIDWLYLSSVGHKRAKFFFKNGGVVKRWLAP